MTKAEEQIAELKERIEKLEKKVFYVAALPEPEPEPEPVARVICEGVRRKDENGRSVLTTCIVTKDELQVPGTVAISDATTPDRHIIWGGRLNDLTDAPVEMLRRLFDERGQFRIRYHRGNETGPLQSDVVVRDFSEIEQVLDLQPTS